MSQALASIDSSTQFVKLADLKNKKKLFISHFADKFQACHATTIQKNAAIKIQRIFRGHIKYLSRVRANTYGFKKTAYTGTNTKYIGREYFFNKNNKVLYKGSRQTHTEQGGYKVKLYGNIDENFVGLVPRNHDFKKDAKKDNRDLFRLNLKTIILNTVVEDKLIIAPNAGKALISNGTLTQVDISTFQHALKDLHIAHRNDIFFRDIKPENMTFNEHLNQVNFIDVDDRIKLVPNTLYRGSFLYTPVAITEGLIAGAYRNYDATKQSSYFRTADEYAFLIALIACTAKDKKLQNAVLNPNVDTNQGCYPGAMNPYNKALFTPWIEQHVRPEYHQDIAYLLSNPANFAGHSPNHAYLADMLITYTPAKPKVTANRGIQITLDQLSHDSGLQKGLRTTKELAHAIEIKYGNKTLVLAKEYLYFLNGDYFLHINDLEETKRFLKAYQAGQVKSSPAHAVIQKAFDMPLSPIQKKSIIVQQPKNLRPQEKQQSKPIINSKLNNIRAAVHSPAEKTNKHPAALFKGKIYYAGDQIKNPTGKVIYTVNPPKPVTVNGKQYYPGDQVTLKHGKAFIVPFLNLDFLDRQK